MYTAYKNLTAQDIGQVPFNAHKQYNFNSSSLAANRITFYDATWSSASIDTFSSGALGGITPDDSDNTLKYFQLEHLFYKNFKLSLNEKLGNIHYLKHRRELYQNVKTISIPNGLCGGRIKPRSFFLSASNHNISGASTPYHKIVDDGYGNLYVSSSNLLNYNTDIRANVLKIGPEKGFKKYDLNVINDEFEAGVYYRRGKAKIPSKHNINYTATNILDDSYFFNLLSYKDVIFHSQSLNSGNIFYQENKNFSAINFNGVSSEIKVDNDEKFHFNPGDDFTITFWADISQSIDQTSYLISKSTTKTVIPTPLATRNGFLKLNATGSSQPIDKESSPQYPFEVYATGNEIFFSRSDGDAIFTISSSISTGSMQCVTCRVSSSQVEIFINGIGSGVSGSEGFKRDTQNNANLYIGNKGGKENYLTGSLSQINIYDEALTDIQILNHYSSSNNSPYIGNVFYESGIVTITHPNYQEGINLNQISWDISSLSLEQSAILTNPANQISNIADANGLYFRPDGLKFYAVGTYAAITPATGLNTNGRVVEYNLSTAWDLSTINTPLGSTHFHNISQSTAAGLPGGPGSGSAEISPHGLYFNPDGSRFITVGEDTNCIFQYDLSTPWHISSSAYVASSSFSFASPRDIYFNLNGTRMYVSDNALDQIKQFTVPTPYDITSISGYGAGQLTEDSNADLTGLGIDSIEAFSFKPDGKTLIIVEQRTSTDRLIELLLDTPWTIDGGASPNMSIVAENDIIDDDEEYNFGMFIRPDGTKLYLTGPIGGAPSTIQEYNMGFDYSGSSTANRNDLNLNFQGTHLIYENEYQCTIEEHEFNYTLNPSARRNRNFNCQELASFATGSNFKPYVTTVGLYNEAGELLVVGKLGQPIRMSDETDTTFVIRWDK